MEEALTHDEKPSFETVWAVLQEVAERQRETERIMKENAERFDQRMKESEKRFDKQMGKFGNRLGEIIEYMVKPCLVEKFRELGFEFTRASSQATIEDRKNNIFTEMDIIVENGEKAMIVEVKSKLSTENITEHIERMEKVRTHADLHGDKRVFLGAVAGMVMNENEKRYALKKGFYVIEPSGETFIITPPEGDYSPREW
jgi:Holliday junction resolvase